MTFPRPVPSRRGLLRVAAAAPLRAGQRKALIDQLDR
mgnify:CR=1 FL=1